MRMSRKRNMNERMLKKQFLKNPRLYRSVVLSDVQVDILQLIAKKKDRSITSHELSKARKISIAGASVVLRYLWQRNYLERRGEPDVSGGTIYRYLFLL